MGSREIDAFDIAILRILQMDNKIPQREIANSVNLSPAAVQRRISGLEAAGIIKANVAVLNSDAIAASITIVVEVHLIDDRSSTVDVAKTLFSQAAEVQQCYYVAGNGGFILVMIVPDMKNYERVSRRLFADNELVLTFRSLIVLDNVKVSLAISLPID